MPRSKTLTVLGTISAANQEAVAGAHVTVWGLQIILTTIPRPIKLGEGQTNADGRYEIITIELPEDMPRGMNVWIDVVTPQGATAVSDKVSVTEDRISIDLQVESDTGSHLTDRRVYGEIRDALGALLPNVIVEAFDRDLRTEESLGRAEVGDGTYEIRYSSEQFRRAEKESADLVIGVSTGEGREIARTSVMYNAPAEARIDVSIGGTPYTGPSTWNTMNGDLLPLLEDLRPIDLREDANNQDLSFLHGETGYSLFELASWIAAWRLEDRTARDETLGVTDTPLPAEAAFAFLAMGEPSIFRSEMLDNLKQPEQQLLIEDQLLRDLVEISPDQQRQILTESVENNVVSPRVSTDLNHVLATIEIIKLRLARDKVWGEGAGTIGQLLQAVGVEESVQAVVVAAIEASRGPLEAMWEKLGTDGSIPPEAVQQARTGIELGTLTRNHVPLVATLTPRLVSGDLSLRDLAQFSSERWIQLFQSEDPAGGLIGVPENTEGETSEEKFTAFATILEKHFERAYPTAALAGRIMQMDNRAPQLTAEVATFLNTNPEFSLDQTRIDHYFEEKNIPRGDTSLVHQLSAVQRIFALSPTFTSTNELLSRGLTSAQHVYFLGQGQLTSILAGTPVSAVEARTIYRKAESVYAYSLALFGEFNAGLNGPLPAGLGGGQSRILSGEGINGKITTLPTLRSLFGTLDYCECSECQSVYSPAAHFVDVLHFLGDRSTQGTGATKGLSVLDVLLTRRPDLGDVELSCANTNTTLPYIDLVNEILEDAVAPPQPVELPPETTALLADGVATHELREALLPFGIELDETAQVYAADSRGERRVRDKSTSYRVINAQSGAGGNSIAIVVSKQTGITAEEARSGPEHISASAYAHLADEVFPFTLPFDLPFETAQIFLDRLGVSQKRILVLFGHEVPEAEHACAALGINATTRKIITDTDGTEAGWKYWGLSEKSNSLPHPDTPTDPQTRITGTWLEVLVRIPVILHRARLSYRELLAVIDTRFINPEKTISIVMPVSDNVLDCDVSAMTITGLDEPAAGRFHRFVRLWRKTNLSIPELDQLLAGRALDDALLAHLSALLDLQQRTDLSFIELVSLFFGLDDHTYRNDEAIQGNEAGRWTAANSLYERIFRTQPVLATASFPRTLAQLTSSATPVGEWALGLLAALRIKENDLSRILAALGITADTALTPDLLWRLWRVPALARGLDLSVTELLDLTRLTGTDPFASPANAVSFTRAMDETAASPFTFPDLDYLLNHKYAANSGVALESKAIVSFLSTLRVNLTDVLQAVRRQPGEEYSAYVTAQLSQLAAKESSLDLTTALAIINGNWTGTVAEREEHLRRYFTGILTDFDEATTALGELPNNLPPDTQQKKLDERFAYLGVRIESFLTRTTMEGVLRQQLASFFDLAQPSCDLIIDALAAHGHPLLDLLEDPAFLAMMPDGTFASDIDSTTLPLAHETLILAHKAALLVHNFAMMPTDVGWWQAGTHADDLGWIALGDLSVDPRAPIPITRWSAMHWVFSWRAALPPSDLTLLEFFDGVLDPSTTTSQVISSLAHLTGWEEDDVVALVTQFGWLGSGQDTVKAECAQAGQLTRVAECMSGLRQLGVKAGRAAAWATLQPSIPIADEIKRALKARYDEKQWLTVNQSIQDVLREQRRDVLVDWLVAHPDPKAGQTWTNATGLSEHYLIDVETNAVVLTSRLKQATASASMFVQRILLGLESDILASNAADPQWKQWDWMRRYRVWEANRKVFLYPENWIEPELRDEKSSFFLDLENFLRQQEVTAETAEDAYREYLTKLEKVANLEIRAMHEENIGEESVLHVVGRTRASTGAEYFYRTQVNHARWTPWQPVNLDINADHLNVAVHNNRLYLLWPQFLEKAEEIKRSTNQSQSPKKYWELRMFWSELRGMKWTPKILSNSFIELPFSDTNGSLENVAFRVHLAPQIQVRVFTTPDASKWAPQSDTARSFEKLGPQISPHSDDLMEYLIVPPGARSAENLIRQKGKQLHFYYSNIVRPPHHSLRPNQPIFTIQGRSSGTEEQMVPIKWFVENNPKINSSNGSPRILLFKKMPGRNQIVLDSTAAAFASQGSFFVWDDNRSYFVDYEQWVQNVFTMLSSHSARSFVDVPEFKGSIGIFTSRYKFHPHYHPFVELFTKQLNIFGLPGLLTRQLQIAPETVPGAPPRFEFSSYAPVSTIPTSIGKSTVSLTGPVPGPHPVEEVDFSYTGAYSPYNWELFFHVPMYIAARLAGNQQFEEALAYYNYIFDPTNPVDALHDLDTPQQRFWITKPFYETTREDYYKQRIESIMTAIARGDDEVRAQVAEWRQHPFNPHLIARMRTVAYQKNVLIKYLETLIAWGDQLFAQDTIESINEALQLYMLAASVLGERPRSVPPTAKSSVRTFYQLKAEGIDDFGNALVDIENLLPQTAAPDVTGPQTPSLPRFELRYFGIPNNENLLNLWNTVDDRLFKVRNSLNLEGVFRQLPLFEPPLDPALLVKAAAAGQSITSVLNDLSGPLPAYRFVVMIEKARAATEATMGLGSAILSALEKRDTEKFAALRSTHEQAAMDVQRDVRLSDIEDAKAALDAVQLGKKLVEVRRTYYDKLVNDGLSTWEFVSTVLSGYSLEIDVSIAAGYILSSNLKSIPVFKAGAVGPAPEASTSAGGQNTGDSAEMAVKTLQSLATAFDKGASMANVLGGYQRREQDWQHQAKLAATELPVVDKQIRSAEIKQQITEQNLRYHDKQRENAAAQDEFLHSKFTNDELYDWMLGQLSTAYFQSYQLAYDLAKRAERCFRYELGIKNSSYVGFGYWDTLHKGLLAGEKLSLDLRRLDAAYHDLNQRQYEMTKHFALSQLDPVALMEFKQTGECFFDIPEVAYDLDNPGHYFRRIKSVSLSIPSVVGPYGSVSCTLTLVGNSVRTTPSASGTYSRDTNGEDQRFQDGFASIQSIATSSATDDAGLFQLRFDDERYLPFEGAGAISSWSLRLNPAVPQFDYSSISDVVVHIKYTAREGGEILRTAASENIGKALSEAVLAQDRAGLCRVLDLKRDLPEEFYRFLHPVGESEEQVLSIANLADFLPFFTRAFPKKKVRRVEVVAQFKEAGEARYELVIGTGKDSEPLELAPEAGLYRASKNFTDEKVPFEGWSLKIRKEGAQDFSSLPPDAITELFLVLNYGLG